MSNLQPHRQLDFWKSTAIIIGAVIGSGVFMNIPLVAKQGGSPAFMALIWLLGGIVWIPQIGVLAEMGTAYPQQGGPYYFIYKAGSPFLAFLYTWTAFLTSDTPTITIIALMAATSAAYFFPILLHPFGAKIFAACLILLFALIQIRNVKTGGLIQIILSICKVFPLLLIIAAGFFSLNSGNFFVLPQQKHSIYQTPITSMLTGISTTIWAYAGFLNILYMAGEVKKPERTLPMSLIYSLIFVVVCYVGISLAVSCIVPFSILQNIEAGRYINPFLHMDWMKSIAGSVFAVMFFISMLGVLNSVIMTQPRLEYAMAKDGLFFEAFGKLHPRYLTPAFSIGIQSAIAILLFLLRDVETLLGYFTLSYVLQNALVYAAIFRLRKTPEYQPSFKLKYWRTFAGLSIIIQLLLAYGTVEAYPFAGIAACLFLIITGLPVYLYFLKKPGKNIDD